MLARSSKLKGQTNVARNTVSSKQRVADQIPLKLEGERDARGHSVLAKKFPVAHLLCCFLCSNTGHLASGLIKISSDSGCDLEFTKSRTKELPLQASFPLSFLLCFHGQQAAIQIQLRVCGTCRRAQERSSWTHRRATGRRAFFL